MALAMPVMRYGFGILKWTKTELMKLDRKTKKILTTHKFHHPKSNINRLYIPRKLGGRGLIGVVDCHRQECSALAKYIQDTEDPLIKIALKVESKKKLDYSHS